MLPEQARLCVAPLAGLFAASSLLHGQKFHQATGVKVGEVTTNSAIVWMRFTRDVLGDGPRGPRLHAPIFLAGLRPKTRYYHAAETTGVGGCGTDRFAAAFARRHLPASRPMPSSP